MVGQIALLSPDRSSPFWVFLSTEGTDTQTADVLSGLDYPTLHVPSSELPRIFESIDYGPDLVRTYARRVAAHYQDAYPEQAEKILFELDQAASPKVSRPIEHPKRNHNVTIPNEVPIELCGGVFRGVEPFNIYEDSGYTDAIRYSARFMEMERKRLHEGFPDGFHRQTIDLIIACPGLLFHLSSSKRLRSVFSKPGSKREFRDAFRFYTRQEGYATLLYPDELKALLANPFYVVLTEIWQKEISAFTAALTFQSFNEFCPVVRLPRKLYRCRGKIAMLGKLLRDGSNEEPKPESVNKLTNQICEEMEEVAITVLDGLLDGHDKRIRIAADL